MSNFAPLFHSPSPGAARSREALHLAVRNSATSMNLMCALLLQLAQERMPRMSQSDVAVLLGLHLTTVARLVRILRSEDIVGRFIKTELQVLNMQRLQELATWHRNII